MRKSSRHSGKTCSLSSSKFALQEIDTGNANALGICVDDGTGIHVFNDVIRNVSVRKGDYVKIFGAIKPSKDGNQTFISEFLTSIPDKSRASVIVHVIRKIEKNPGSVMSCFMLEAIQSVAAVMGNGKQDIAEPMQTTSMVQ